MLARVVIHALFQTIAYSTRDFCHSVHEISYKNENTSLVPIPRSYYFHRPSLRA